MQLGTDETIDLEYGAGLSEIIERGTSKFDMTDIVDPIMPKRWIPPFRRNDWTVEEVVETRVQLCGHYDQKIIPNCEAVYTDPASEKRIIVTFQNGDIWKYEVPHPVSKQLVVLGDDNRIYRTGEPMLDGVMALDNWLEPVPQD